MIIGLSGTLSSGKDTLADHLQEKFGLMHISTGDIVREIAQVQRGSVERPVLYDVANELRHSYGGGVLVDRALDRYQNSIRTYAGVVITGIRSIAEAKAVKEKGGTIVFIDAPIEVRYARMQSRQRDGEARISLEAFIEREQKELTSGISDADFNITQIGQMADITLQNAGSLEEFFAAAEKALLFA
jgi:dephospho-CoA kinase